MLVRADHAGKPPLFAENWLSAARCAQAGRPSLVSGAAGCCWSRARSRRVWRRAFSARSGSLTSVVHAIPSSAAGCRLRSPEIRERQFSRYVAILTRKTKRAGCMAGVGVSRAGRQSSQDLPRRLADVPARDRVAARRSPLVGKPRIVLTGRGFAVRAASATRAAPAPLSSEPLCCREVSSSGFVPARAVFGASAKPPDAARQMNQSNHTGGREYPRPAGPLIAQLPPRRRHALPPRYPGG